MKVHLDCAESEWGVALGVGRWLQKQIKRMGVATRTVMAGLRGDLLVRATPDSIYARGNMWRLKAATAVATGNPHSGHAWGIWYFAPNFVVIIPARATVDGEVVVPVTVFYENENGQWGGRAQKSEAEGGGPVLPADVINVPYAAIPLSEGAVFVNSVNADRTAFTFNTTIGLYRMVFVDSVWEPQVSLLGAVSTPASATPTACVAIVNYDAVYVSRSGGWDLLGTGTPSILTWERVDPNGSGTEATFDVLVRVGGVIYRVNSGTGEATEVSFPGVRLLNTLDTYKKSQMLFFDDADGVNYASYYLFARGSNDLAPVSLANAWSTAGFGWATEIVPSRLLYAEEQGTRTFTKCTTLDVVVDGMWPNNIVRVACSVEITIWAIGSGGWGAVFTRVLTGYGSVGAAENIEPYTGWSFASETGDTVFASFVHGNEDAPSVNVVVSRARTGVWEVVIDAEGNDFLVGGYGDAATGYAPTTSANGKTFSFPRAINEYERTHLWTCVSGEWEVLPSPGVIAATQYLQRNIPSISDDGWVILTQSRGMVRIRETPKVEEDAESEFDRYYSLVEAAPTSHQTTRTIPLARYINAAETADGFDNGRLYFAVRSVNGSTTHASVVSAFDGTVQHAGGFIPVQASAIEGVLMVIDNEAAYCKYSFIRRRASEKSDILILSGTTQDSQTEEYSGTIRLLER